MGGKLSGGGCLGEYVEGGMSCIPDSTGTEQVERQFDVGDTLVLLYDLQIRRIRYLAADKSC